MSNFILFDFDGVIGDTFHVAHEVFSTVFPGTTEADLRSAFERNINVWMEEQRKNNKEYRSDIDFSLEYGRVMRNTATIFPGMSGIIALLSRGYSLAIVSSNISVNIADFLNTYGLADLFSDIIGSDTHDLKVEKINNDI